MLKYKTAQLKKACGRLCSVHLSYQNPPRTKHLLVLAQKEACVSQKRGHLFGQRLPDNICSTFETERHIFTMSLALGLVTSGHCSGKSHGAETRQGAIFWIRVSQGKPDTRQMWSVPKEFYACLKWRITFSPFWRLPLMNGDSPTQGDR